MSTITSLLFDHSEKIHTPHAHLVGACGAGMKALAEILLDDGWNLTGSDFVANSRTWNLLTGRGMKLFAGHKASSVSSEADVIIFSAAIPDDNVEIETAKNLFIPTLSYVEAISKIVNELPHLAIAGTHGKSSTTAWIVSILNQLELSPTSVCGAERIDDNRNGQLGDGKLGIIEACEYRRHFLHFMPRVICLLNIEPDHFDCYVNFQDMKKAYELFLQNLNSDGTIVYNSDCEVSSQIVEKFTVQKIPFSLHAKDSHWYAQRGGGKLELYYDKKLVCRAGDFFPGRHQQLNLAAAGASLQALGIDLSKTVSTEQTLTPPMLRRRYEVVARNSYGLIIDDYAHHPTEIRMTLEAVKEQYPDTRIRCCFQPHQLSRTQRLREDFVDSLAIADSIFILPVYGARENESEQFIIESENMVNNLIDQGHQAMFIPSLDQVWRTLETDACNQDILLTLGAGDITRIHNERTR